MSDVRDSSADIQVMSYNILADELTSNFVPRTMEDPSNAVIAEVFGSDAAAVESWASLKKALNAEYAKWHKLKTMIETPAGSRIKARGLWGEMDLLQLAAKGWKLDGIDIQDTVTETGKITFLGILKQSLSMEKSMILYNAIQKVQVETRAWEVRGPKILKRIEDITPTLLCMQEYDIHNLLMPNGQSFKDAMSGIGYEGANFLGPGQEAAGVSLFWLRSAASLANGSKLPPDGFIPSGLETTDFGNIDLQEPGIENPMDRRPLAFAKLIINGQPVCFCGVHLMTGSRDKSGAVRSQELATIRQLLSSRVSPGTAVFLCGDFNVNSRKFADEHIWKGEGLKDSTGTPDPLKTTGYLPSEGANRFIWERTSGDELRLRDSYDFEYGSEHCSSTRTGTRLETIDYIFYDEDLLQLVEGSHAELRCPNEPMPNLVEPSDHIPIYASFKVKSKSTSTGKLILSYSTAGDLKLEYGTPTPRNFVFTPTPRCADVKDEAGVKREDPAHYC